jgi:hypothetical protein
MVKSGRPNPLARKNIMMIQRSFLAFLFAIGLLTVACQSASAQYGWHRPHYGYYGYPRPVVVPPPIVIAPGYGVAAYPPPAYVAPVVPAPVVAPVPPPPPVAPAPVYMPSYTYGAIGPRGFGIGYSTPGFGVYVGGR